jgi:hypothetical protein
MQVIGRRNGDNIDARVIKKFAPVGFEPRKASFGRALFRYSLIGVAQGFKANFGIATKHNPHMTPGHGMALSHKPRADHRHAK